MSRDQDKKYFRCIIQALQDSGYHVRKIAEELGEDERDIRRWKAGERIPLGSRAIRLCKLYERVCPERQCRIGPYVEEENPA